jgi:tRNA (guanine10-N2)-dimethyltransferase
MKLIFELSGENETLPLAELDCICTDPDHRAQVAVADCPDPKAVHRLAMTHTVLEYLGECRPDISEFSTLLSDLCLTTDLPFAGRVKKVHSGDTMLVDRCFQREFERLIGTMITGPVNLLSPDVVYRAILSEDRCYFGRVLYTIDRGGYDSRNPGKRAFFHPGVMMPRIARALVNISCARPGELLLDPFCGTGGILLEAGLMGIHAVGSDFDPFMVCGSRQNLSSGTLLVSDAASLPLRDASVDAVVTDFPYGQSVCIRREGTMERLYDRALSEIHRVLKDGRRAVVVTHRDISDIAGQHMTILQRHTQRVHKSLTRRILVLERSR